MKHILSLKTNLKLKYLYIIISEVTFLCGALTLTLTVVYHTDTLNELNLLNNYHY